MIYDMTDNKVNSEITRDYAQQLVQDYKMVSKKQIDRLYRKISKKILKIAKKGKTSYRVYIRNSVILENLQLKFQSQGFVCSNHDYINCLHIDWS